MRSGEYSNEAGDLIMHHKVRQHLESPAMRGKQGGKSQVWWIGTCRRLIKEGLFLVIKQAYLTLLHFTAVAFFF